MISNKNKEHFEFVNIQWLMLTPKQGLLYDNFTFIVAKGNNYTESIFVVSKPVLKSSLFTELFGEFYV